MGIESGQLNAIMKKPTVHGSYEKENDDKSFQERIDKAMEKVENVIENANMVAIAKNLLESNTVQEILSMDEEQITQISEPYDAAVIVAICKTLEKNNVKGN